MKKYAQLALLMAIILVWPHALFAGRVKVINSSSQNWSGGVAGMHGVHYHFTIEFSGFNQKPRPDTLWIGTEYIALDTAYESTGSNTKVKYNKSRNTYTFEINANTSNNENVVLKIKGQKQVAKLKLKPPASGKGVAIVSYKCDKKQAYFIVPGFNEILPPLQYP